MNTYTKALAAFVLGLVLFLLGFFLHEPDLRLLGYGSMAAALPVFALRNAPPLPPAGQFDSEPPAHPEGQERLP